MDAESFLRGHNMHFDQQRFSDIRGGVLKDMDAGLRGEPSSLYMIPTFVTAEGAIPPDNRVIVIDAGGTNLRVALVAFDSFGRPTTEKFSKYKMPGSEAPIGASEFFDTLAGYVLPLCGSSSRIGFCFSYVCEIMPDGDGKLLRFCKEVKVNGAEGVMVCAELEKALKARGAAGTRRYKLINDTVAAMLGAKAAAGGADYDGYAGFILGTGTNLCYDEPCGEITKNAEARKRSGRMIINMESGCFSGLLRGDADMLIDAESEYKDDHIAEKMISGGYMGRLIGHTFALAAKDGILPAAFADKKLLDIAPAEIDAFCSGKKGGPISKRCSNEEEQEFCRAVVDMLFERAAKISAAFFAAICERTGFGVKRPLCVCAEGTTLEKSPLMLPKIKRWVADEITAKTGASIEFLFVESSTIYGTAVAGLIG